MNVSLSSQSLKLLSVLISLTPITLGELEFMAVDIGFAISSTSFDADSIFKLMKDTIKTIASKYWTHNLRYGVIVFGSKLNIELEFGEALPSLQILKKKIDAIPSRQGPPNIIETLEKGKEMFEKRGTPKIHVKQDLSNHSRTSRPEKRLGRYNVYCIFSFSTINYQYIDHFLTIY